MDDYISREAARPDAFCDGVSCQECPFLKNSVTGGCRVDDFIKAIPPADVRPVIPAQWIALDIYRSEGNYKCSNCGQPCYVPECMGEPMYSVCPNCGAMMGGTP